MANKRQRKKNLGNERIGKLVSFGVDRKQAERFKNKEKEYKAEYRKAEKRTRQRRQADILESLGFKRSSKQRTLSEKSFNKWYQEELDRREKIRLQEERRKKAAARKKENDYYLLIFWKDKTAEGYAEADAVENYKKAYRYMDNDYLIEKIKKYLAIRDPNSSAIGTSHITILPKYKVDAYISFMQHSSSYSTRMADINDWVLVYKGKAAMNRYHELLLAIHTVVRLMYDTAEKADFIGNLLRFLPQLNKKTAARLAKDIQYGRIGGLD